MISPSSPPPSLGARTDDRRPRTGAGLSQMFLFGSTVVVLSAAVVAALAASDLRLSTSHGIELQRAFELITVVSAPAVLALCWARWHQVGEGAALWAGAATLVLGVAVAARPDVIGPLLGGHGPDEPFLEAVSHAGFVVAPLLFAAGLVPVLEHRPLPPAILLGAALALTMATAVVFRAFTGLGPSLSVSRLTSEQGSGSAASGFLTAAAWLTLAVGYTVRGLRRQWLYTWGGLTLFALTLSGLGAGLASDTGDPWAVGAAALEALALILAVIACGVELAHAYEEQTSRLLDSELDAETAEVRERVRLATSRSRRHDLANAITAIEGAAMILEREFDSLTHDDREALARVLDSGTGHLRRLLVQESGNPDRVSLAETIRTVADKHAGTQLDVDVDPGLVGTGSTGETVEALRQLVEYVCRREPSEPVTIKGERDGDWVVLRVEDRGPTMSREERRAIADGEPPRASGHDEGMGVRVAARLMRGQGGDLWVEARPEGGSSFGICLPAVTEVDRGAGGAGA